MATKNPAYKLLIAFLAVAPVVLNMANAQQSQSAFDVISIKRNVSKGRGGLTQTFLGRFVATNVTLKMLFRPAYGVRDYQIAGGPSWIDAERYDIQATAGFAAGIEDVHRMLQTMLAEQFGVMLHREPKEVSAYALLLGKNGPKLKAMPETDDAAGPKASKPVGRTMLGLAELLSRLPNVDRPVFDRTGLQGNYDVSPLFAAMGSKGVNSDVSPFTAVQDFGLKLESQNATIDVLVIDHAEKPPEN
jgi:uncharacterized protein (TIGR03435 family)